MSRRFYFISLIFILSSCAAPGRDVISTFTPAPASPPTSEATATEIIVAPAPVTKEDLGIVGTPFESAFWRMVELVTREGNDFIVSIDGERYTLDGGWNLNEELNNFYAPSTVNAIDKNGNKVTLIWNTEGLFVNSPLSTDAENPTRFNNDTKLITLQKILLQRPNPFTQGSEKLGIRSESSENGRSGYLRTDIVGIDVKRTNIWLEYEDQMNTYKYLVNPININDVADSAGNTRKVFMCTYGEIGTDRLVRESFFEYLDRVKIVWPIINADELFFDNFQQTSSPVPKAKNRELFYLLNTEENSPMIIDLFSSNINDQFNKVENDPLHFLEAHTAGDGYSISIDPTIQLKVIPCLIK